MIEQIKKNEQSFKTMIVRQPGGYGVSRNHSCQSF
jgi:hypothetical protein